MNEKTKYIIAVIVCLFVGATLYHVTRPKCDINSGSVDSPQTIIQRAADGVDNAQRQITDARDDLQHASDTVDNIEATAREQSTIIGECQQIVRDCQSRFEQIAGIFAEVDNQNEERKTEENDS